MKEMTQVVVGYVVVAILLALIIFQDQLTSASPKDSDNWTTQTQTAIPELPANSNTTESHPEKTQDDGVVHCAALGCPGNPPNPHGPPTEEPTSR
jgi:hypothetical protein